MAGVQPDPNDLISLREASDLSGYSPSHLRHLVAAELLWGKKIGRNYVTSRTAVENYQRTHPPPGRPKGGLTI